MSGFVERLKLWWSRVIVTYRTRRAKAGLAVLGLLVLVETLLYALGYDVAETIAKGLWWFIKHPMGIGGLAFLGLNLLLVGYAFIDATIEARRRTVSAEPRSIPIVILSADDKDAIAKIRTLWRHSDGAVSAYLLHELFDSVITGLSDHRPHTSSLLRAVDDDLQSSKMALENILEYSSNASLDIVIERFNAFYKLYVRTGTLLYQIHKTGELSLLNKPYIQNLVNFRMCNNSFRKELLVTTEYKNINKRLGVFPTPVAQDAKRFLGLMPWEGAQPPETLDGLSG